MDGSRARSFGLVGLGVVVLWVGWGNAHLLLQVGKACGIGDPVGLHLDGLGRVVYANRHCPLVVYDGAWPTFLALSAVGLAFVGVGARRLRADGPAEGAEPV